LEGSRLSTTHRAAEVHGIAGCFLSGGKAKAKALVYSGVSCTHTLTSLSFAGICHLLHILRATAGYPGAVLENLSNGPQTHSSPTTATRRSGGQ